MNQSIKNIMNTLKILMVKIYFYREILFPIKERAQRRFSTFMQI